jgi:PBP1b-binding outer membrane lipoprotein LpoB
MTTKIDLMICAAALALAGCVSTPAPPVLSASHPANPQAASSPLPPPQPGLLAITNMVIVKPVTGPTPEHHHGHNQHDAKPKSEEKK